MQDPTLRITRDEALASEDDRFHRFRLIGWWDQAILSRAKVLVIGAGALGNEIVKNLALLGFGNVLVVDLDLIENSNLSRSILFREDDTGRPKAEVAAKSAREIYPGMRTQHFVGDVVSDVGVGVFRWADVILGGLDNREARLAINRNCYRVNRPWIDGAIEQIQGVARAFVPDGPCYECTMCEGDWELLRRRRSCNLLSREEMEHGKTPTTPTISSIIAGVQCQEAVKLLHGLEISPGQGWVFEGMTGDSWTVDYQRREDCLSHDVLQEIIPLDGGVEEITAMDALHAAREALGPGARIEFCREMIEKLVCPKCGMEETVFMSASNVDAGSAECPACSGIRREVVTFYRVLGDEPFCRSPLAEIGVPPYDILIGRDRERAVGLELAADASCVLGSLAGDLDGLEVF